MQPLFTILYLPFTFLYSLFYLSQFFSPSTSFFTFPRVFLSFSVRLCLSSSFFAFLRPSLPFFVFLRLYLSFFAFLRPSLPFVVFLRLTSSFFDFLRSCPYFAFRITSPLNRFVGFCQSSYLFILYQYVHS